jgi:very-short-patch-repair endonuclease
LIEYNKKLAVEFRRKNSDLYHEILEEYAPVFDRGAAVYLYLNNIPPPRCHICDCRLVVTKNMPKSCETHSKSTPENCYTYDQFIEKYPGTYEKWDGYKRGSDKIKIFCNEHGEYMQLMASRINGHRCQQCYFNTQRGNFRIDTDVYLQDFKEVHSERYDYSLVKFRGAENKIEIICKKHGSFWQSANVHREGHGCPECANEESSIRNSTEEAKARLRTQMANYIKNNATKKKDTGPELKCRAFLEMNNISYEQQYIINDLKTGSWAYDFYIKDMNLLIETDGEYYHRKYETYNRDKFKNRIAKEHGYVLLRLSDLNLDFPMLYKSIEEIEHHTCTVMENRKQFVKDKHGNNIK